MLRRSLLITGIVIILASGVVIFNNKSRTDQPRSRLFGSPAYVPSSFIQSFTYADFNGDDNLDIVTANLTSSTDNNVSVLLGDGLGGFSLQSHYDIEANPWSVISGDFDEDGHLDIATANDDRNLSVLFGDGLGDFSEASKFSIVDPSELAGSRDKDSPDSLISNDFNDDGHLDIAVASADQDNVSILLGDGLGSFSEPSHFDVGEFPIALISDDFDGNGTLDLATVNLFNEDISILLGDGSGHFSDGINVTIGDGRFLFPRGGVSFDKDAPISLTSGDFDGNGVVDILMANIWGDDLWILFGDSLGSFSEPVSIELPYSNEQTSTLLSPYWDSYFQLPELLTPGDFNDDGALDVAVGRFGRASISILLGDGKGGFSDSSDLFVGDTLRLIDSEDFDKDGHLDIVVGEGSYIENIPVLFGDGKGGFINSAYDFTVSVPDQTDRSDSQAIISADFNDDRRLR